MKQGDDDKKLIASIVLMERFVRDIYPAKHSSAIQPLQWSILRYLARMPDDRCEVRWIANFLGITRAPVTRAVATLESRNLVSQQTCREDARTKKIVLTKCGVASLADDPIVRAAARIRSLPEIDQVQFINVVRHLALDLESNGDEHS